MSQRYLIEYKKNTLMEILTILDNKNVRWSGNDKIFNSSDSERMIKVLEEKIQKCCDREINVLIVVVNKNQKYLLQDTITNFEEYKKSYAGWWNGIELIKMSSIDELRMM